MTTPLDSLIVHSATPFNAEPPLARLLAARLTTLRDHYVRCHGEVPRLDDASHRVRIDGQVATPLDLSMADLRTRFPERTVTAVMQCAGNRRADLQAVRPTSGDPWGAGAIGNAAWTGVRLVDVLDAAGAATAAGLHVAVECADAVALPGEAPGQFGVSIGLEKARAPEVLLAWAMNGEALLPEHGFPLRLLVPGYAGVRSAKWLRRVTVQDRPSDNPVQARDYKLFPADVTAATVAWDRGTTIDEMPLTSAICDPAPGAAVASGPLVIRGYAVAGTRAVARVEVSCDGGETWTQASLQHDQGERWSWTTWAATVILPPGFHHLVVRAWDAAGQTQPSQAGDVWNFKGYLSTAWHRVAVSAR